uniref:Glucose / sorbosone dehydrogenase n=1 Tax=Marseillevirus LCMAC102 TaxID=2506603 RepID=A0A481YUV5_9VIRU|nr:MAG: glucose / sorbosone dehydrogenase [Marseillevirus LCMAC102]
MNDNVVIITAGILLIIDFVVLYWFKRHQHNSGLKYHRVSEKEEFDLSITQISNLSGQTSAVCLSPNRVIFTSKDGKVGIYKNKNYQVIYDVKEKVKDFDDGIEGGLMCVAVSKILPSEVCLCYTIKNGEKGQTLIVNRYEFDGETLIFDKELFKQDYPTKIHHAGTIAFNSQGGLYLSTGDGGPQGDPEGHAQNLKSYRGKILRLSDKSEPEIIAFGLRNPWKFSIDPTDRMFVADVGYSTVESIYLITDLFPEKPYNCGWNQYEGSTKYVDNPNIKFEDTLPPIFEYKTDSEGKETPGRCVIGGYYIDRFDLYIFGDYVSGYVYALQEQDKKWIQVSRVKTPDDNHIYSLALIENTVWVLGTKGIYSVDI